MMSILLLTIASLLITSPVTTFAYSTPEEVLFQNDFFFPPTNRHADERVRKQEEKRLEGLKQRQQEVLDLNPSESTSLEDILTSLTNAIESIDNKPSTGDSRRDSRLLDRVERRQTSLPQTLNSGAPLAPTGAGSILAAGTMVAAMIWTLRRARRMEER